MKIFKALGLITALTLAAGAGMPAFAETGPKIEYQSKVTLKVGESVIVHGIRGDCGKAPAKSALKVPASKTGKFSIGKLGWRESGKCNGATPAVQVIFTAVTPGKETVKVEGDAIKITVK